MSDIVGDIVCPYCGGDDHEYEGMCADLNGGEYMCNCNTCSKSFTMVTESVEAVSEVFKNE